MMNLTELQQLFEVARIFIPNPEQEVLRNISEKLIKIASSTEADVWKEIGNDLLDQATKTPLTSDAQFYLVIAGACLGQVVMLGRQERQQTPAWGIGGIGTATIVAMSECKSVRAIAGTGITMTESDFQKIIIPCLKEFTFVPSPDELDLCGHPLADAYWMASDKEYRIYREG